ncbi:MAG: hypothetical protein E7497_06095 [Ruminococcus sp.]|nr:hypothetical protein [Ruminococcus sp.]
MQEMPIKIAKWTEIRFPEGKRFLKDDAPDDVRKEAIEWEKDFYKKTSRRRIINLNIDTA